MPGRSTGHPIDPLTIIVSLEEQVNDNAQRVDNAMRNLVDLARAVRSVLQKVEELHDKVDERLGGPGPSLAGTEFAAGMERQAQTLANIEALQDLLAQRVEHLENKEAPQLVDYAPEFQRTEAILENLRLQHESLKTELQSAAGPKLAQQFADFTKKYPEGSIASIEDVRNLGNAVDKMAQEHAQFGERLDEYKQLKDSSALLTILKSEHIALQRRLDEIEAGGGSGDGSGGAALAGVRSVLDELAQQQGLLQAKVAELGERQQDQPDAGEAFSKIVAPLEQRLSVVESRSTLQSEDVTTELAKLAYALDEVVHEREEVSKQLADFARQNAAQDDAMNRLAATQSSLEQSLAEQKLQTPEGVEETAAGLKKIESSVTQLTSQLKSITDQQQVQFDALAGIESCQTPLLQRLAELETREVPAPVDNSSELGEVQSALATLTEHQNQLQEELKAFAVQQYEKFSALGELEEAQPPLLQRIAELEAREIPQVADHAGDLQQLQTAIEKLAAEHQQVAQELKLLAEREPEKPADYTVQLLQLEETLGGLTQQQAQLQQESKTLAEELAARSESVAALASAQAPLLERVAELEAREPEQPVDYSPQVQQLQSALDDLAGKQLAKSDVAAVVDNAQAPLLARLVDLEAREPVQVVATSDDGQQLQAAFEGLAKHQEQMHKELQSLSDLQNVHLATFAALESGVAPLAQRLAEVEARKLPDPVDHSSDLHKLEATLAKMTQQQDQLRDQLSHYADQQQIAKVMDHLTELQARMARNSEQLLELEQNRSQGQDEQRKQMQNQLDIQERQRALLEEIQVRLELQQEQLETQQALAAEYAAVVKEAAEKKRRVSDEPHKDPSMGSLIESALHIERGEYAEAVRCLEAARQVSDNPKLLQALELARQMLNQQTKSN